MMEQPLQHSVRCKRKQIHEQIILKRSSRLLAKNRLHLPLSNLNAYYLEQYIFFLESCTKTVFDVTLTLKEVLHFYGILPVFENMHVSVSIETWLHLNFASPILHTLGPDLFADAVEERLKSLNLDLLSRVGMKDYQYAFILILNGSLAMFAKNMIAYLRKTFPIFTDFSRRTPMCRVENAIVMFFIQCESGAGLVHAPDHGETSQTTLLRMLAKDGVGSTPFSASSLLLAMGESALMETISNLKFIEKLCAFLPSMKDPASFQEVCCHIYKFIT